MLQRGELPHKLRIPYLLPNMPSFFSLSRAHRLWSAALVIIAPAITCASLQAQANYATPYTFSLLAGSAGSPGSVDATGAAATFNQPYGISVDSSGTVYVADHKSNIIRKVTAAGVVTTLAGTANVAGINNATGTAAVFSQPTSVAVDSSGNVFVADYVNNVIRKIDSKAVVTTFAGTAGSAGSTDATGTAALFNQPYGVAVDSSGNLYVTEYANDTIRKITSAGVVTTFAGTAATPGFQNGTGTAALFSQPTGIAVDSSGNVYVADTGNNAIRKITSAGVSSTLAGGFAAGYQDGTGTGALFRSPRGVAVDSSGNVYVADSQNSCIRKITPAGVVTTIAGLAGNFATQTGTGPAALFDIPTGVAVDSNGKVYVSNTLGYTIEVGTAATAIAPAITLQPSSQTVRTGEPVVFHIQATGLPSPTYQWYLNGTALTASSGVLGTTSPSLYLTSASAAQSGTYTCAVTNASGSVTSSSATLSLSNSANAGRIINFSCRSNAGTGSSVAIAGFALSSGTGTEPVLVRASGPALAAFNITGLLEDPQLTLQSGATVLGYDYGWKGSAAIASAAAAVDAFQWTNSSSLDSALVANLAPGLYSAQVSGYGADSGVELTEIYDAGEANFSLANPQLINISSRSNVGTGSNVLIAGFVIGGDTSRTVLIRASGPALSAFGVSGTLADPVLQLYSGSNVLLSNAGWNADSEIALAANTVGAFSWGTTASADSAILVTLPPGAYTAEVSGAAFDTGISLIEVYALP